MCRVEGGLVWLVEWWQHWNGEWTSWRGESCHGKLCSASVSNTWLGICSARGTMETTVTGSDTEVAATARRQTTKNMSFFSISYVLTVSLHAVLIVYILPLLMGLVIQGRAWYSHAGVGFRTRSCGDQWWPVFEQPPDAFDVINYNWAIIM